MNITIRQNVGFYTGIVEPDLPEAITLSGITFKQAMKVCAAMNKFGGYDHNWFVLPADAKEKANKSPDPIKKCRWQLGQEGPPCELRPGTTYVGLRPQKRRPPSGWIPRAGWNDRTPTAR